jgi:hypothetical protein
MLIEKYRTNWLKEVMSEANIEGDPKYREEVFTDDALTILNEANILDNPMPSPYRSRGVAVNAYDFDDEIKTLHLVVTSFEGIGLMPPLQNSKIKDIFKKVENFYNKSTKGLHEKIDQSAEANDLAKIIFDNSKEIRNVSFILITDMVCKDQAGYEIGLEGGASALLTVWDVQRFYRYENSGKVAEEINIKTEDYGSNYIKATLANSADEPYNIFIGVINGQFLFNLYDKWGTRLLERNVRAYLQARGSKSVNSEIRKTIREEPEMFMAYNNGLTITTNNLDFDLIGDQGESVIKAIGDFQIVNGGQTIASIWHAKNIYKESEISKINVQVKIAFIKEKEDLEEIADKISYTSNRQNAVNTADFRGKHPFHIVFEKLSRSTWAPDPENGNIETKWFYERARGLYDETKNLKRTEAEKKKWTTRNPKNQKFDKLLLAKSIRTFELKPDEVCLGAQKNFTLFSLDLIENKKVSLDEVDYKESVAKIILWKTTEKIITSQKIPGYRAQIVTYTLALIFYLVQGRIDFLKIWSKQLVDDDLKNLINEYTSKVRTFIVDTELNVTEYVKKEEVWIKIKKKFDPDRESISEKIPSSLVDPSKAKKEKKRIKAPKKQVKFISKLTPEDWFSLAKWGKSTNHLTGIQRSQAFNIGRHLKNGKEISSKLGFVGEVILNKANEMGFVSGKK